MNQTYSHSSTSEQECCHHQVSSRCDSLWRIEDGQETDGYQTPGPGNVNIGHAACDEGGDVGGDDEHRDLGDDVGHHDAGELGGEEEGHQGGGAHGQETHDESLSLFTIQPANEML